MNERKPPQTDGCGTTRQVAYQPIDCSLHDRLEAAATLGREVVLEHVDEQNAAVDTRTRLVDVFARAGEEFVRTSAGLEVRLDRILALDDIVFRQAPRVTVLQTARLRLGRFEEQDAAFTLALLNDPAFLRYIGDKGVRTIEDARAYIRSDPMDSYERHGFGLYVIELAETGEAIGMCGLLRREALDAPDLGYATLAAHRRQGFAREAAAAVLDHARDDLDVHRVVAVTSMENDGSMTLLRGLGFEDAGTTRLEADGPELRLFEARLH